MKKILFLHDTALTLKRGAELTIAQLVSKGNELGFLVEVDLLDNLEEVQTHILSQDLLIICNTSRCKFERDILNFVLDSEIPFCKIEFDYNFCVRRNILCTLDRNIRNCCDTDKFHLYRTLFANSQLNIFQSPKHFEAHVAFYGEAVSHNYLVMPPTVDVENISISDEKTDAIPFFSELSYLKGGDAFVDYALEHPNKSFVVYGSNKLRRDIPENIEFREPIDNAEVLKVLGKTKEIVIKPVWPEPSGRLAAEAFLSGCELITNDRVGTWSFDFYPDDKERAKEEMQSAIPEFWDKIKAISKQNVVSKSLGKVLLLKSYAGLGDIFFTLPAVYKLKKVSESVTYALSPRLVSFFQKYLKGIQVVDATQIDHAEFDTVIEFGNYPIFDRSVDQIEYVTSKKVKQHSIQHYIDAVCRFHKELSNKYTGFPYFDRETDFDNLHYTLHPGAGFLLKIWPTENYAELIEEIYRVFPKLRCKIILGKDDPNPQQFLSKEYSHIDLVTGDLHEVGEAMAAAIFHIGNDAGITHVAGAFNVPTVGIYGPTGPGSWGVFLSRMKLYGENPEIVR
ncbi:hypothetical protein DI487_07410 [Flavobacterium sediminis]|uniref:Lipopolysaccharide heptosyltransferase family protein n=1 Tax=Flavobacterium sediminis TaxID=2201181 RepID=A0A2U8QV12_9FLAO|nr:glycosyltransferase family 9 protein [Flavobacterium sediminis]AWM13704.1 hypothetical protein DI487_07410 [Flavobacterium sediminis]